MLLLLQIFYSFGRRRRHNQIPPALASRISNILQLLFMHILCIGSKRLHYVRCWFAFLTTLRRSCLCTQALKFIDTVDHRQVKLWTWIRQPKIISMRGSSRHIIEDITNNSNDEALSIWTFIKPVTCYPVIFISKIPCDNEKSVIILWFMHWKFLFDFSRIKKKKGQKKKT